MTNYDLEHYERAKVIPGRSLTRSKAPGRLFDVGKGPLYTTDGNYECYVTNGNDTYIDMVCGLGAIGLGVLKPSRARNSTEQGVRSLPHVIEARAAEDIIAMVAPWASQVRFTKTGSEATHAAYRIAKRATGRRLVAIGDWAYHGWHEWCDARELPSTLRFAHGYGFHDHRDGYLNIGPKWYSPRELAAVFIEPHRWEPVNAEWLTAVRDYCARHGIVLVFDEMIYGCRWAMGGATEYFGVKPDLACFGKAIGNGASIACVVGNDVLRDHGEMISGTYSGEVSGLYAVCETLRTYATEPVITKLWDVGQRLEAGLNEAIFETEWTGRVVREGRPVHQRLTFSDPTLGRVFAAEMVKRGVLWHPQVVNVMYAHTPGVIDRVVEAARASLLEMQAREFTTDRDHGDER